MAEEKPDIRAQKAKEVSDAIKESIALGSEDAKQLKERVKQLDKILSKQEDINAKIKVSNDYFDEYKSLSSDIFKTEVERDKLQQKIAEHQRDNAGVLKNVATKQVQIVDALQNEKTQVDKLSQKRKEILKAIEGGADIESEQVKKLQQEASIQQTIVDSAMARVSAARDALTDEELMYLALESSLDAHNQTLETLKKQDELQREINKKMGISGALVKGLGGLLAKVGLEKHLNMDLVLAKMRQAAYEGGPLKAMLTGVKELGSALKTSLSDPLVLLGFMYKYWQFITKSALAYQDAVFKASKDLGLNVKETEKLYSNFLKISTENSKLGLTNEKLVESFKSMNESLGFIVDSEGEFISQSATISRNLGISADNFQNVQLFAFQTNKSVKESFAAIVGSAKAQGARLKIAMTERQIFDAIGKVSATIYNNFNGNVSQLAKAVVQATKLGVSLDQINQAGMSLLDFESSISKEFEAQLLTGKNLNLNLARQYALVGDTENLMKEITTQIGNQTEWNKMNVLQQQSLAEAMGMSKEAVDEMFKKQQLTTALGEAGAKDSIELYNALKGQNLTHEQIAERMGKEAADRALQVSAQEQLTAAMENMSKAVGQLAEKFTPVVGIAEALAKIINGVASNSFLLGTALISAGLALKVLLTRSMLLLGVKKQTTLEEQKQTIENQKQNILTTRAGLLEGALNGVKKIGALFNKRSASAAIVEASAKSAAANAPLTFGLGSLAVAAAVGAGLYALMSSLMSGDGETGVGGAIGITSPIIRTDQGNINPMNTAAATAQANTVQVNKSEKPGVLINFIDQSKIDPLTGKKLRQVFAESSNADAKSGQFGNVLSFR